MDGETKTIEFEKIDLSDFPTREIMQTVSVVTNEDLVINKNKPWRSVIRRIVSDGRGGDENVL